MDVVVWPGEGPAHSTAMVEDELRGLEAEFGEGIFIRRHTAVNPRQSSSVNA